METLPEYNVQICHPNNDMDVTPVSDKIKTLEGVPAHLPYGSTSGRWGDSGSGWTEQHGTPIGADIVYYAGYEDTFYRLDADFPVEQMKELVKRAYAVGSSDIYKEPLQEYIVTDKNLSYDGYNNPYNSMSELIFGFAPKGMVVVWVGYTGGVQIEIGRYQAEAIKNEDEKLKKWFDQKFTITRKEMRNDYLLPDASPEKWDNYRNRYSWKPIINSDNKDFRVLDYGTHYYNGEAETMFRPWLLNPEERERAIPKDISFVWELSKDEGYSAAIFFNWKKTNEAFKKAGQHSRLEFKVAEDNNSVEVTLNGQPLETDSIRIYQSSLLGDYKDSYK